MVLDCIVSRSLPSSLLSINSVRYIDIHKSVSEREPGIITMIDRIREEIVSLLKKWDSEAKSKAPVK